MKQVFVIWAAHVVVGFFVPPICRASEDEVLYDHANGSAGLLGSDLEWGEVVKIAEVSRITEFSAILGVSSFSPIMDDIIVRLYSTDRSIPVDLLWTGVIEDAVLSRNPVLYSIDVPEVLVPRVFAFTTQLASGTSLSRYRAPFPRPTNDFGEWGSRITFENNHWVDVGTAPTPFAVRFKGIATGVIPEPTSLLLVVSATAFVLLPFPRRHIRRRCKSVLT